MAAGSFVGWLWRAVAGPRLLITRAVERWPHGSTV
jgi:hypothetical protein